MERREIELIPKELEEARKRGKLLRTSRFVGFGFLGLSILVAVLILSVVGAQTVTRNNLRRQISEKEARVSELSAVEEKVVALADKNTALTQIFSGRSYYSILLEALKKSIPSGVKVIGLSASAELSSASQAETVVGLSGETLSYTVLATFLRNLVAPEKGGSLFTQAGLTSVTFDPTKGTAQFVVEVTLMESGLKKGWEALLE